MNSSPPALFDRLAGILRFLFWGLLVVALLLTFFSRGTLETERAAALEQFQAARKSRAIALIHRQDRLNFLGIPIASYINIEDSEAVLRAIRLTPDERPIDLILHTPGGLVLASEQIARALIGHKGRVTVFVPHYAMSGGTLIALAADEIVMDPNAVLGPVDPQIAGLPAASIIKAVEQKPIERVSDVTLMFADISRKAQGQVQAVVTDLLTDSARLPPNEADKTAKALTEGPLDTRLPHHDVGRPQARAEGQHRDARSGLFADGALSPGARKAPHGALRGASRGHVGHRRPQGACTLTAGRNQAPAPARTGSVKQKVSPGPSFAVAHMWPPCASMIERQTASPIPIPCSLVV
jgi:ClpP class serine protease